MGLVDCARENNEAHLPRLLLRPVRVAAIEPQLNAGTTRLEPRNNA
jgi:hypothetical protein